MLLVFFPVFLLYSISVYSVPFLNSVPFFLNTSVTLFIQLGVPIFSLWYKLSKTFKTLLK